MDQLLNSDPLLCRELIGRTHELQVLSKVLQQVIAGQLHFVLLSGEAGVGNTKEALIGTSVLKQVITHLQSQRLLSALSLAPLTPCEHRQLIEQILKQPPPDQNISG